MRKTKYTKIKVTEEALLYDYKSDFKKGSKGFYEAGQRNGWMDEVCSHMLINKNAKPVYWTDERLVQEIDKHKTVTEFRNKSKNAYMATISSNRHHLYRDKLGYTKNSLDGTWTYKELIAEAKKFNTVKELSESNHYVYTRIIKKNLQEEAFSHFIPLKKPNGFWTIDNIKKEVAKYRTRSEFKKAESGGYRQAVKNGWLDDIFEGTPRIGNLYNRCLYQIINTETNEVYVGITGDYHSRMESHHNKHLFDKGFVSYKLTGYLPAEQTVKMERKWIKHFNEHLTFTCLNKTKGGELGGIKK